MADEYCDLDFLAPRARIAARIVQPVEDKFDGDRIGNAQDPSATSGISPPKSKTSSSAS